VASAIVSLETLPNLAPIVQQAGPPYVRRLGGGDPRQSRVFVVVSRLTLIDSRFSSILCDALVTLPKSALTDFIGGLPAELLRALNDALRIALVLEA
jgi:mRNA-degrading endonuclease toxin of MazEF toxin-antitoxin module